MATLAGTSRSRSKKGRFTSRKPRQKKVPVDANNNDICEDETADPGSPLKWNEGRRIMELGEVENSLLSGCVKCGTVLNLTDTVSETKRGLGSILYLRCSEDGCDGITGILTGKRHRSDVKGSQPVFDVNTKLAAGTMNAGMGFTQARTLLASMNIPGISQSAFKVREREAGPATEKVAKYSCDAALDMEKSLCAEGEGLAASFDGAWQKRGSGRCYNSLTGHASFIGAKTGKLIGYEVRCKKCAICEAAARLKIEVRQHDCRKNWSGSAKAMEPDLAVSMLNTFKDKDASIKTITMDDDSTTIARARTEVDPSVSKISDRNRTNKNFTKKLYDLQKEKKYTLLKNKTISHLQKCFSYALAANKENPLELKSNLEAITPHVFGDHSLCRESWCGFLKDQSKYRPKNLPYSKYLHGEDFRNDLNAIFMDYANQSERLCNLGSSQSNESFNNSVASKAKKSNYYGGSESLCYRVAAAGCQKNIGPSYMVDVNKTMMLSPGRVTVQTASCMERKRTKDLQRHKTMPYKKRRIELKKERSETAVAHETREGPTYSSSIDCSIQENPAVDLTKIPDPYPVPVPAKLPSNNTKYNLVYFDLETTGLGLPDITQMSAVYGDRTFNRYIVPEKPISYGASLVTNLSSKDGKLYKNGVLILDSIKIKTCLTDLMSFLRDIENPVLVAHNAETFDAMVMCNKIIQCNISFEGVIKGFIDTLTVFRSYLPGHKCYKQEVLVRESGINYNAHDSLEDCRALAALIKHHNISVEFMIDSSFTYEYALSKCRYRIQKDVNLQSLTPVVEKKVITQYMASKIASSGLSYSHLKTVCSRDAFQGLYSIFREDVKGVPRVTKNTKIVMEICNFFQ